MCIKVMSTKVIHSGQAVVVRSFDIYISFIKTVLISILAMAMMLSVAQATSFSANKGWSSQWMLAAVAQITSEEAVKKAKRKYKGKVLSAKKSQIKGSSVYKIKMLMPDSVVKTVWVDGQSGQIIRRDH